jgi:hypothetical protein
VTPLFFDFFSRYAKNVIIEKEQQLSQKKGSKRDEKFGHLNYHLTNS